jgi:hypothetical protein
MALVTKTKIKDMEIGDMIVARYTATGAAAGVVSEVGTCTAAEIPLGVVSSPNGRFNFIKVDKGLLVADRVVQTSVSWLTLNIRGYTMGWAGRIPLTTQSYTSIYSDSGGSANPSAPVSLEKTDADWYPGNWIPSNSDNAPTIVFKLLNTANVPKVQVTSGSPANTITISTAMDVGGPYTVGYTGGISAGIHIYDIAGNPEANYLKLSFAKVNGYGYNNIVMRDARIPQDYIIRSLSGGCGYMGLDGNVSLTEHGLGMFPSTNEWDKYIMGSDLDGKITAGDESVWHYNQAFTYCQDSLITGTMTDYIGTTMAVSNAYKPARGAYTNSTWRGMWPNAYSTSNQWVGFRPVLEYPEDDRCTNIWY